MTEQEKKEKIRELEIRKWDTENHIKAFGKLIFDEEIINELLDELSDIIAELKELKNE